MKKLLIICSIILLSACNSGGTNSAAGTIIVAGNWLGSFTSTNGFFLGFDLTIDQGDTSVVNDINTTFSGIYRTLINACGITGGTFTGTISGAQVTFTITDNSGAKFSFVGSITNVIQGIARAMNGLLNASDGVCGAFTGTWTMNRT